MYSCTILLLGSIILTVFAAPVPLDAGLVKKDFAVKPRSGLSVTHMIQDLMERSTVVKTAQSKTDYDVVSEINHEGEEKAESEFDTVKVLNERGIIRTFGGNKRGITRPSGGSKRGITRPSGGSKRGITRPSGGSKRDLTE
ncbi:hypothetical protein IAQ61_011310 [Plenodomus lingam]|uniref:uncharacterized protein n=1 Tax=Leptosphaeria maculans TaxID=5022 RepID=UPI0033321CBA|nr:hypothetical protein IAQ61_011310 [Plenodomus lingam]